MLIQIMSYYSLRIQSDSVKVIKTIKDSSLTSSNSVFIRHIHHLLMNARYWDIQLIPRECNKIVDCLAKMDLRTNQRLKTFEEISREVQALFSIAYPSGNLTHKNIM
ncbi:hypothetical protein Golax_025711 [Gossypium laxum]|uniref:RNase H type-1 domain-containing protein n=1 Tax=Gossypium laxum TaxID=34288 RepID=A0A7J9B614_9ROSI|nr:hypothetical protein [Gossypium laxum]